MCLENGLCFCYTYKRKLDDICRISTGKQYNQTVKVKCRTLRRVWCFRLPSTYSPSRTAYTSLALARPLRRSSWEFPDIVHVLVPLLQSKASNVSQEDSACVKEVNVSPSLVQQEPNWKKHAEILQVELEPSESWSVARKQLLGSLQETPVPWAFTGLSTMMMM